MAKSYFETLMEDNDKGALGYAGELGSSLLDRLRSLKEFAPGGQMWAGAKEGSYLSGDQGYLPDSIIPPMQGGWSLYGADIDPREFAKGGPGGFDPTDTESVKKMQGMLGVEVDGIFGPETEAALRELQGVPGSSEEIDNMAQGLVGGEIGQTDEIGETVENLSEWAPSSVGEGTPMLSPLGQYISSSQYISSKESDDDFVGRFIQGEELPDDPFGDQDEEDIIQSYDDRAWLNQAIRAKGIRDAIARDNMQQDNPFFREAPEIEDVDMGTEGSDIAPKSLLQGAVKKIDSFNKTWLDSRDFLGKGFRKVPYTMGNQKIEFIMDLNTGTLVGVPERFKGRLRDKSLIGPNTFKPFIEPELTVWGGSDGKELEMINPTENLRNRFTG